MPLTLVPPRKGLKKGNSPNWRIRGQYLGVKVDQSSGTPKRSLAKQVRRQIEAAIERRQFAADVAAPPAPGPTFVSAAVAYMEAGRRRRYVGALIRYFGDTPIADIDQAAIDAAALAICPAGAPGTRNTTVHTPVSAILHHAGVAIQVKRPKGYKGRKKKVDAMIPDDAFAVIAAAKAIDPRFSMLLKVLLYTGPRLGDALALERRRDVLLTERVLLFDNEKNDDPMTALMREDLRDELAAFIGEDLEGRLFPFHQGGHLKHLLTRAKLAACGMPCPVRRPTGWRAPPYALSWVTFHTFRHTWATWMRRYGGLDVEGLVATRTWKDPRSAAIYAHVVPREEWQRVERLPAMKKDTA